MRTFRHRSAALGLVGLLGAVLAPVGCSSAGDDSDSDEAAITQFPEGALINVTFESTVGVLLDDLEPLPTGEATRIQSDVQNQPVEFWKERARMQLRLTTQRQYFRHYYYGDPGNAFLAQKRKLSVPDKGQLPLPPMVDPAGADLWSKNIAIVGTPKLQTIDGHKFLAVKYTYAGVLVTDLDSPARSDKALARIGGKVEELHNLPVDPDLLRQRTGLACLTEREFPPNSVDSENAWRFFEQSCTKDSTDCHTADEIRTGQVRESCIEALQKHTGLVKMPLRFERVAYDKTIADKNRIGTVTTAKDGKIVDGADMAVRRDDLEVNRLVWRYVGGTACELEETDLADNRRPSCVIRPEDIKRDGGGWRHVLEFNGTTYNVGTAPMHIGNVNFLAENGVQTQAEDKGLFEKSACSGQARFRHYGDFSFSGSTSVNKKSGSCIESTTRFSNNEISPIFSEYGRCIHQGVEIGWGDEAEAGLACQWVDVTDAKPGKAKLGFSSNPDGFLCEGKLKSAAPLTAKGLPTPDTKITAWEPTSFKTDLGKAVEKPACTVSREDWKSNNKEEVEVTVPDPGTGGLVAHACRLDGEPDGKHFTFGPTRDCAFKNAGAQPDAFLECTPGQPVTVSCTATGDATQVVRVCEGSQLFKGGIDCMSPALDAARNPWDAMAHAVLTPDAPTEVKFICPAARDKKEIGGRFSLYSGSYVASAAPQQIKCEVLAVAK